jgi:MFS family permease
VGLFKVNLLQPLEASRKGVFVLKFTGFLFISPMPFMIAGELIGTSIMEHSTWRWVYILNIILTAVSGALIFAFYNPV